MYSKGLKLLYLSDRNEFHWMEDRLWNKNGIQANLENIIIGSNWNNDNRLLKQTLWAPDH